MAGCESEWMTECGGDGNRNFNELKSEEVLRYVILRVSYMLQHHYHLKLIILVDKLKFFSGYDVEQFPSSCCPLCLLQ